MVINSQELKSAIAAVKPAIGTKGDIPALKSILVKDNTLTAYNLETGIITTIDGHTDEPFLLPPKAIDLIPKLPETDSKRRSLDVVIGVGRVITLECGDIIATYPVEGVEDFPEVEAGGELSEPIQIDGDWFRWAVKATAYAVSKQDTVNPVYGGILLDCRDGYFNAVCRDAHRMSWAKKESDGEFQLIVPPEAFKPILSMSEDVTIKASRSKAIFECGDVSVVTRLIAGNAYDYQTPGAYQPPHSATVDRKYFLDALNRVSLMAEVKPIPKTILTLKNGSMTISINQSAAHYSEEIPAQHQDDVRIGFNHKKLIDCIGSFDSEELRVDYDGPKAPVKVTGNDDVELVSFLSPVLLREDE